MTRILSQTFRVVVVDVAVVVMGTTHSRQGKIEFYRVGGARGVVPDGVKIKMEEPHTLAVVVRSSHRDDDC